MPPKSINKIAGESVADKSEWLLYHGIKELLRCDEAEVVHGIAHYVMSQYGILNKGANFVERCRRTPLAPLAMVLGALTRFLEVRQSIPDGEIVWVARLENERRAIEEILKLLPAAKHCELILSRSPKAAAVGASMTKLLPEWRKIYQTARHLLNRELELFRVLRIIEMIGYYAHYLHIFRSNDFRCAIMSSHSNPHGIAFNLAARRSGVPIVLVTHGMPVRPVARLAYDAAIVHCRAARDIYASEGSAIGTVFIHGRKGDYESMKTQPSSPVTAGIFLCKDVVQARLETVLRALLADNRIGKVIVRPHPKNLWRGIERWVAELGDSRVALSIDSLLREDLRMVDLVIGGNSSVLVDAVTAGRPALYVSGLDYGNYDLHGFVERGLIREFSAENLDPEEIFRFYNQPGWSEKLKAFAEIEVDRSRALQHLKNSIAEKYTHKV